MPHLWSIELHLRPVALVRSSLAASNSHVGPHREGLLLSSYFTIAVEQNGAAPLILMEQTAVLEVCDQGGLALHSTPKFGHLQWHLCTNTRTHGHGHTHMHSTMHTCASLATYLNDASHCCILLMEAMLAIRQLLAETATGANAARRKQRQA